MSMPSVVIRYNLLVRAIFFPSAWLRWMAIVGLLLTLPASLVYCFLAWMPLAVIAGFGDMLMAVSLMVGAIALPSQLVAINSSKQFAFISVRRASLLLLFLFCLGLPLVFVAASLFFDKPINVVQFLCVFVMVSVAILLGVVLAVQIPMGQNLVFFFFWALKPIGNSLLQTPAELLLLLLVVSWVMFSLWWLRWRPEKYQASAFGLAQKDMLKWQLQQRTSGGITKYLACMNTGIFLISGKPNSVMGSVLTGVSDGSSALLKKAIVTFVIFFAVMVMLKVTTEEKDQSNLYFMFFFMTYLTGGWANLLTICRNLQRAWLLCPGARPQFFKDVEGHCVRLLFYHFSPLLFFHLIFNLVMNPVLLGWLSAVFLAVYCMLFLFVAFYFMLMIYARVGLALGWLSVMGFVLMTVSGGFLLIIADRWEHSLPLALQISAMVLLGLVISCLLLRNKTKQRWNTINFQRAYA